jgi:hypothetical protein
VTLLSPRNHPLVVTVGTRPLITVEYYMKWYSLFCVGRIGDADVIEGLVQFDALEEYALPIESAFVDHVPNPRVVERYAEALGVEIDPMAHELIWGRWRIEVVDDGRSSVHVRGL